MAHLRLLAIILMAAAAAAAVAYDTWDDVSIVCPLNCVCQRAHLRDLNIAQWTGGVDAVNEANTWHLAETQPAHNHNEVAYATSGDNNGDNGDDGDDDDDAAANPLLKQAMCMVSDKGNVKDVLQSLPPDVQAFVMLYNNGPDKNITIRTSELLALPELIVLELRATMTHALRLVLDVALPALRYANFETVELVGTQPAAPATINPSELFDYVPESERVAYNVTLAVDIEPIIVSYEEYAKEQRMAKMATFVGWHELRVLRMHGCQLDELHWQMFDGLHQLRHLSLEATGIAAVPPFALFGAPHLRTLSLARNAINDLHYRALAGLLRLERLDLSGNRLRSLSEQTFPPFPRLRTVDLRDNPIRSVGPMTFGVMNSTWHVYLGSEVHALRLAGDEAFRSLGLLRTLSLANATTASLSAGVFRGLRSVQRLRMRGAVRRIEFDAFAEMWSVRELVLSECALELISMDTFFGTRDLEVVDLSRNRLVSLPPGLFDGQPKIKEVYLQHNRLTVLPGDIFGRPALRLMRLTDNPWTCACQTLSFWRQKVTNAARRGRVNQRCVTDLSMAGGARVRCNDNSNQFEYGYEGRLTPRCATGPAGADVAGRGVYYSMRKTLNCRAQRPAATAAAAAAFEAAKRKETQQVSVQQQRRKQKELRRKKNELRFQLLRERKAQAERLPAVVDDNEMGNELLGL